MRSQQSCFLFTRKNVTQQGSSSGKPLKRYSSVEYQVPFFLEERNRKLVIKQFSFPLVVKYLCWTIMDDVARGVAAGSAFGEGCVYVMTYTRGRTTYYKIGCTSRDPKVRLKEIQRNEGIDAITLVDSVPAKEMNGAETAAQEAVKAIGLRKDPARGGATDWFIGSLTSAEVFEAVKRAVKRHNRQE